LGVIQKQAIKGTIYTYLGALVGFITAIILFPRILGPEKTGLINILIAYSLIVAQFASLGLNSTTTRMFSYFRSTDNKHNGYLFLLVIITLIGFIITTIIFYLLKPTLIAGKEEAEGGTLFVLVLFIHYPNFIFLHFFLMLLIITIRYYLMQLEEHS